VEEDSHPRMLPSRQSTGVDGLDAILHGGFVNGSTCLLQGGPGTGKTILANQVAFNLATRQQSTLYVTFLCETHDRILQQLSQLAFFDDTQVNHRIHYLSALAELDQTGLDGVLSLLHRERKRNKARLVVIEGLYILAESAPTEQDFRKFLSRLSAFANLVGCNILLLSNTSRKASNPEFTMVDGWIELRMEQLAYRTYRSIEVHKFRASNITLGRHMVQISADGLRILPRFETLSENLRPRVTPTSKRVSTGVPALDAMAHGGLPQGSTTLLVGPTGAGKTSLGIHFMSACDGNNPGLMFGFGENADRLFVRSRAIGVDLEKLVDAGHLEILWFSPVENLLDDISYRIMAAVQARGVKRLFIDGVDAMSQSVIYPQRVRPVLNMLDARLRQEGVTSMMTAESAYLTGHALHLEFSAISAIAENILLLRYLELDASFSRALSWIKVRDSDFNSVIHEYAITNKGLRILGPLTKSAMPPAGIAHPPPSGERP